MMKWINWVDDAFCLSIRMTSLVCQTFIIDPPGAQKQMREKKNAEKQIIHQIEWALPVPPHLCMCADALHVSFTYSFRRASRLIIQLFAFFPIWSVVSLSFYIWRMCVCVWLLLFWRYMCSLSLRCVSFFVNISVRFRNNFVCRFGCQYVLCLWMRVCINHIVFFSLFFLSVDRKRVVCTHCSNLALIFFLHLIFSSSFFIYN